MMFVCFSDESVKKKNLINLQWTTGYLVKNVKLFLHLTNIYWM